MPVVVSYVGDASGPLGIFSTHELAIEFIVEQVIVELDEISELEDEERRRREMINELEQNNSVDGVEGTYFIKEFNMDEPITRDQLFDEDNVPNREEEDSESEEDDGEEEEEEEGEEEISKERYFKLLNANGTSSGRFSGMTPKQAASKALTSLLRESRGGSGTNTEYRINMVETTRGADREKEHIFIGSRIALDQPEEVVIRGPGGESKSITYGFRNKLERVKAGEENYDD